MLFWGIWPTHIRLMTGQVITCNNLQKNLLSTRTLLKLPVKINAKTSDFVSLLQQRLFALVFVTSLDAYSPGRLWSSESHPLSHLLAKSVQAKHRQEHFTFRPQLTKVFYPDTIITDIFYFHEYITGSFYYTENIGICVY